MPSEVKMPERKNGRKTLRFGKSCYLCSIKPILRSFMEKMTEKDKKKQAGAAVEAKAKEPKKKVSKTWEAIQKWRGSVIINDPTLLL